MYHYNGCRFYSLRGARISQKVPIVSCSFLPPASDVASTEIAEPDRFTKHVSGHHNTLVLGLIYLGFTNWNWSFVTVWGWAMLWTSYGHTWPLTFHIIDRLVCVMKSMSDETWESWSKTLQVDMWNQPCKPSDNVLSSVKQWFVEFINEHNMSRYHAPCT